MKKHGSAIRLLTGCLIVVLLGCVYAAVKRAAAAEDAAGRDTLIPLTADRIAGLSWMKQDGSGFTFERADGQWRRTGDDTFAVNQAALNSLAAGVTGVGIYQTMEGVTDLGQYGLDEPDITFTVTDRDGNSVTAAVGNANETAGSVYAYLTDDPGTVYSVLVSLKTNFDVAEEDLRGTAGEGEES